MCRMCVTQRVRAEQVRSLCRPRASQKCINQSQVHYATVVQLTCGHHTCGTKAVGGSAAASLDASRGPLPLDCSSGPSMSSIFLGTDDVFAAPEKERLSFLAASLMGLEAVAAVPPRSLLKKPLSVLLAGLSTLLLFSAGKKWGHG